MRLKGVICVKSYFGVISAFILTIVIFMGGCSIRRVPDNSVWESEEAENYYWSGGGYSGEMPVYNPDYIEAWRMHKYYEYSDAQNYSNVYDTEGIWRNGNASSDNTAQKSEMVDQSKEISKKQAPERSADQPLNRRKRKARLSKQSSQDKSDKDSDKSGEDESEERRRRLREKIRRARNKEHPEKEDDDSSSQGREKRLKDRK